MTDHFLRSLGDIQEEQEARLEREMDPDMALVSDYITGELSEAQAAAVRQRIATDADFRDLAEPLLIAAEHGPRFQPMPRAHLERKWLELRRRIGLPDIAADAARDPSLDGFRATIKRERRRAIRNGALGIAALILIALMPQAVDLYRRADNSWTFSGRGQAETRLPLPDGSSALVGPNTTLVGRRDMARSYHVNGEVTFDVVRATTPFSVTTRSAHIQVVGTRFTVHAYAGEPTMVTVIEGVVLVREVDDDGKPAGDSLSLTPGQRARVVRGYPPLMLP